MGAREELKSYLISALNQETIYPHEAEEAAEKLINDLVHEEAEKIRNSPGWCQGEWMDSRDREHAADLIDPYAK